MSLLLEAAAQLENCADPLESAPDREQEDRALRDRMAALRAWYHEDAVWAPGATYGDEEA